MKKTLKGTLALVFSIVTIFATMLVAAAIDAPTAKVTTVTHNAVSLSWSKVSDASYYQIDRSTDGSSWSRLSAKTSSTSYTNSSLTPGVTYYYRVRSVKDRLILSDQYSSWSNVVSAKPVLGAVTNFEVSELKYNSVTFTWKSVAGANGYALQKYVDGNWKTVKSITTNSVTYTGIALGKTNTYRVRAYITVSGSKVYGTASASLKVKPELLAPTSVSLTKMSTTYLKIEWPAVEGALGYKVYNKALGTWVDNGALTWYTAKGLEAGKSYGFLVKAYSGSYEGIKTSTYTFKTTPAKAKNAKVTTIYTSALTFSWDKVTGANGYQPSIYNYTTKTWTNLEATTKTSITAKDLPANTKFFVKVRAFVTNTNVAGSASEKTYGEWSEKSAAAITAPAAPSYVKLTKVTASSLTLKWAAVDGATGYKVYHKATKTWKNVGNTTSTTFTGLSSGTAYDFNVKAYSDISTSSVKTSTYTFKTAPAAVSKPKSSKTKATETSLYFSWEGVTGAERYKVAIREDSSDTWVYPGTTAKTSYTFTGLKSGTKYIVMVRAYVKNTNVSGISGTKYGDWSAKASGYTRAAAPVVTATATDAKTITLSWNAVSGAKEYVIEKYDINNAQWRVFNFKTNTWQLPEELEADYITTTTATSLADKDIVARSDVYRVTTVCANTNTTNTSDVVIGCSVGINVKVNSYSAVVLTWPAIDGADTYIIHSRKPVAETLLEAKTSSSALTYNAENNTYQTTLYLAPNSYYSLLIYAVDTRTSNGITNIVSNSVIIATPDVKVVSSTDSNYNSAVNSQLLYLARSINNTKLYKGAVKVNAKSNTVFVVNKLSVTKNGKPLKFMGQEIGANGEDEVKDLFKTFEKLTGEKISPNTNDSSDVTYNFNEGKTLTSTNAALYLQNFVEPTAGKRYAYIYNGYVNNSSWKNGFEGIKTTKNSDGSVTIEITIKQEKTTTNYHDGLIPTLNSTDFAGTEGLDINSLKVGKSTLKVVIDADGILKSYSASSPFVADLVANLTAEESGTGVSAGDKVGILMGMKGDTSFSYTFTR